MGSLEDHEGFGPLEHCIPSFGGSEPPVGAMGITAPEKSGSLRPRKSSIVQCLCSSLYSLCLAFSDADIESDFVLMTSAYSQYLKDSCKLYLALIKKFNRYSKHDEKQ